MVKGIWPKLWLVARTPVSVWNTAGGQSIDSKWGEGV